MVKKRIKKTHQSGEKKTSHKKMSWDKKVKMLIAEVFLQVIGLLERFGKYTRMVNAQLWNAKYIRNS